MIGLALLFLSLISVSCIGGTIFCEEKSCASKFSIFREGDKNCENNKECENIKKDLEDFFQDIPDDMIYEDFCKKEDKDEQCKELCARISCFYGIKLKCVGWESWRKNKKACKQIREKYDKS